MLLNREVTTQYSHNSERKYIYRITEDLLDGIKEYGIEVIREDKSEGIITRCVREEVKHISSKKEWVFQILSILSRNEVSPIHLVDVIGEYMDSSSCLV
ncbi:MULTISPECIES: DUF6514 family protein [Clostridium]|uniref:Uncharacterized protein n=1 Tax=Clostridium cibarium TaxID=2762247 RepID=A0ABR8PSP4_9CLOT|nr:MULTISPECIES: DUF6514 family protein [Clostridium]MBD7911124.1 hypothetical protein [Clostridium cibarium]